MFTVVHPIRKVSCFLDLVKRTPYSEAKSVIVQQLSHTCMYTIVILPTTVVEGVYCGQVVHFSTLVAMSTDPSSMYA